jgi:MFS family permease
VLWFSQHIALQLLGRGLQGFASSIVWSTGLAVLVDTVGEKHIGEYMGWLNIGLNTGSLIAPMVGGVVFAKAGYNAVFGVAIAVVGIDILFRLIMKEKVPSDTVSMAPLRDDLEAGPTEEKKEVTIVKTTTIDQETTPSVSSLNLATPKSPSKLPPILRLLCSLRFDVAIWGVFVNSCVFSGFQAVLPVAVKTVFGWDSTGSGLIFLPLSVPALLGPVVGRMTDRYGGRWFAMAGFMLLGVAVTMLRVVDHNSKSQQALLCVLLFLCGCCMTLVLEPLGAAVTHGAARLDAADAELGIKTAGYYAQSYALFNMAWAAGNAIGPVWAGMMVDKMGWNAMALSLGLLGWVSAIPVGLCLGGWFFEKK